MKYFPRKSNCVSLCLGVFRFYQSSTLGHQRCSHFPSITLGLQFIKIVNLHWLSKFIQSNHCFVIIILRAGATLSIIVIVIDSKCNSNLQIKLHWIPIVENIYWSRTNYRQVPIISKLHFTQERTCIFEPIFEEDNCDKLKARQQNYKFVSFILVFQMKKFLFLFFL